MAELVKNVELSLLEPTKCKLEQLNKLYSEYLACAKETFAFWQSNKGITQNILHHSTYKQFRLKYKLPAQLIIRARGIVWNRRKICDESQPIYWLVVYSHHKIRKNRGRLVGEFRVYLFSSKPSSKITL